MTGLLVQNAILRILCRKTFDSEGGLLVQSSFLVQGLKEIKLSVPKDSGAYETKALLDCALWELDIVDQDYGTRADTMLQHQGFVRALNSQARLKGLSPPTW
jgi:hypothetical protein